MALPEQVQQQLDEAERISQGLAPQDGPPIVPAEELQPPAQEPPAAPPAPPVVDEQSWQQRYSTLQGIHRADVDRLTGQVTQLQGQVSELTAKLEAKAAPPASEPAPASKLITDRDIEAFGPDMIDVIQRAAQEIAAPYKAEVESLRAELKATKGTVDTVATTQMGNRQKLFLDELTKLVPDWQAVNANQAFLQWLSVNDPLSGVQRQKLLESACEQFDHVRLSKLFDAWKSTQAAPAAAPVVPPQDTLTGQVQPGSSRGSVPPDQPRVKTWSPETIDAHYKALARGDFRGREGEADRIEAEIDNWLSGSVR